MVMHPVVREEVLRDDHIDRLRTACSLVGDVPCRTYEDLGVDANQVEVLITSWGCPRFHAHVVDRFPRLRLIAHLAGSVKGFIDEEIWRRGIQVTNAVAAQAVPVAEFTLAAIVFANKRVFQLRDAYRHHRMLPDENPLWKPWRGHGVEMGNYRKHIGIVGASNVGRQVIELARPLDYTLLVYDPYLTETEASTLGAVKAGLAELLSQSDVVSLHVPLLAQTRGMIGAGELALMKDGATLINTARGALVDQNALAVELANRRLFALLDTTQPEDLPQDSPLFELDNLILTPHIAGAQGREGERLADLVADELDRFRRGDALHHAVRLEQLSRLA
ncbi:MAG: hydroxyacid dehydrogenase [Pseudomonadales bacterium]|nr:hydroxyacid dehydrogenase [Pseudomonadales bacterium]